MKRSRVAAKLKEEKQQCKKRLCTKVEQELEVEKRQAIDDFCFLLKQYLDVAQTQIYNWLATLECIRALLPSSAEDLKWVGLRTISTIGSNPNARVELRYKNTVLFIIDRATCFIGTFWKDRKRIIHQTPYPMEDPSSFMHMIQRFAKQAVPAHLAPLIFRYLDPEDLLICAQVCKRWNKEASSPDIWDRFVVLQFLRRQVRYSTLNIPTKQVYMRMTLRAGNLHVKQFPFSPGTMAYLVYLGDGSGHSVNEKHVCYMSSRVYGSINVSYYEYSPRKSGIRIRIRCNERTNMEYVQICNDKKFGQKRRKTVGKMLVAGIQKLHNFWKDRPHYVREVNYVPSIVGWYRTYNA